MTTQRFAFDDKHEFLRKVEELVKSGVPKRNIHTFTPYHVHGIEDLLDDTQSGIRFFAGFGAVTGLVAGFAFTIFTVKDWSLITGGKPLVSVPAFMVIAYELTILLGVLIAVLGFFHFTRMPAIADIASAKREFSPKFEIEVRDEERK